MPSAPTPPSISIETSARGTAVRLAGRWTISESVALEERIATPPPPGTGPVDVDASGITALDTVGALVLAQLESRWRSAGREANLTGLEASRARLLRLVEDSPPRVAHPSERRGGVAVAIEKALDLLDDRAFGFLSFVGDVAVAALRQIADPRRIRWSLVVRNLQTSGANALPIVGLLSFLIGIVIAYQAADQLHRYGADIFVVDLVGLSMVRELAPLITAIIVAGRTGSAYTAQIGTMRVTEEVDALQVLALSPIEVLVLPKVFALVVALPLLVAYADAVGVLGGMLMTASLTAIGPEFFLEQFPRVVHVESFFVGIGKAPVFALIIATVGCYQGFQVSGSAESVGQRTTVSVVQSIFLIIVLDAVFSILFSVVGL